MNIDDLVSHIGMHACLISINFLLITHSECWTPLGCSYRRGLVCWSMWLGPQLVPLSEVVIFSVLIESFHCVYAATYILINTMFIQCCHS